jgi:hypothetical protein
LNERVARIGAIIRADFLIRFRRLSTVVIFLLLSALAYLWVPAPSTGRALMVINGARARYDSAAIGMATAMLAAMFVGLAGFYVVSNAVKRDVVSRCGFVLASTTMRSGEYIAAKFFGNLVFLTTFVGGFMLTSMAMLLVRGEAPLEPLVFAKQYLFLVPPALVFVSAVAILFESIPWLAGRFGDVAYFFLWSASLSIVAIQAERHGFGPTVAGWFDFTGFAYSIDQINSTMHTTSASIGASDFNPAKALVRFPGLSLSGGWLIPRVASALIPLPLLGVARLFFHRFDPVRLKAVTAKGKSGWLGRINSLLKPITRPFAALSSGAGEPSFLRATWADAMMTFVASPLILLAVVGLAIAALVIPAARIGPGLMPVAFALVGIFLADIACRDRRSGTLGLIYSSPLLQRNFILWKLASSIVVAAICLAIPAWKMTAAYPLSLLSLLAGVGFLAAAATALGTISTNAKTFIVLFLSFWYIVINDHGLSPSLDFAGFYGTATPMVSATYVGIGIGLTWVAGVVQGIREA